MIGEVEDFKIYYKLIIFFVCYFRLFFFVVRWKSDDILVFRFSSIEGRFLFVVRYVSNYY